MTTKPCTCAVVACTGEAVARAYRDRVPMEVCARHAKRMEHLGDPVVWVHLTAPTARALAQRFETSPSILRAAWDVMTEAERDALYRVAVIGQPTGSPYSSLALGYRRAADRIGRQIAQLAGAKVAS